MLGHGASLSAEHQVGNRLLFTLSAPSVARIAELGTIPVGRSRAARNHRRLTMFLAKGARKSTGASWMRRFAAGSAALAALGAAGAGALASAPAAEASPGTYCSVRGECELFSGPSTGLYYFGAPGQLPAGMLCWQDGQWTNLNYSTNRWFKMRSAAYGTFWAPASEVINQTSTPHC
jgi:hypothetical protein